MAVQQLWGSPPPLGTGGARRCPANEAGHPPSRRECLLRLGARVAGRCPDVEAGHAIGRCRCLPTLRARAAGCSPAQEAGQALGRRVGLLLLGTRAAGHCRVQSSWLQLATLVKGPHAGAMSDDVDGSPLAEEGTEGALSRKSCSLEPSEDDSASGESTADPGFELTQYNADKVFLQKLRVPSLPKEAAASPSERKMRPKRRRIAEMYRTKPIDVGSKEVQVPKHSRRGVHNKHPSTLKSPFNEIGVIEAAVRFSVSKLHHLQPTSNPWLLLHGHHRFDWWVENDNLSSKKEELARARTSSAGKQRKEKARPQRFVVRVMRRYGRFFTAKEVFD